MWQRPGGRALRFRAVEVFEVERVAFSWHARFPLGLRVVDGFDGRDGVLEVRLLGLALQRQRGPEVTEGEALRYLAELPWVPPALERNSELEWHGDEVRTRVGGRELVAELERDEAGDVVGASSRMRARRVGDEWVRTPWGGRFSEYETLGGLRLPTRGEAYWDLPDGRFVYWRAEVTSAELLP
jgi:hypothetical protein